MADEAMQFKILNFKNKNQKNSIVYNVQYSMASCLYACMSLCYPTSFLYVYSFLFSGLKQLPFTIAVTVPQFSNAVKPDPFQLLTAIKYLHKWAA